MSSTTDHTTDGHLCTKYKHNVTYALITRGCLKLCMLITNHVKWYVTWLLRRKNKMKCTSCKYMCEFCMTSQDVNAKQEDQIFCEESCDSSSKTPYRQAQNSTRPNKYTQIFMWNKYIASKQPSTLDALWNIFIFKDLCNNFSISLKPLHLSHNTRSFLLHAYIQKFIK